MDYTSLKEITESIISLIQAEVDPGNTVKVLPELLRNENLGVGFYLFHVQENSHYKNYPATGRDTPPVNYTPMALNLFYQLSANWKEADNPDAYEEQRLMSVAMKALHDNSTIGTTTLGKKINVKITLQTITPAESVQYWAAAESPVRLSAYYEVSVVFLEPEKPKSYAGRVLSYGNFIFLQGPPQITGSQSILEYTLPGEVDPRQIKAQPAQAPVGDVISFLGTGFNSGTAELLIISPLWSEPAVASGAWNVTLVSEGQLDMTVQTTATLQDSLSPVDIIPGLYSARVSITEHRTLPNGSIKTFNHLSNQFPFSVMPGISLITSLGSGEYRITCYIFQNPGINNEDIQVYLGDTRLDLTNAVVLASGEFKITGTNTIEFKIPAGTPAGQTAIRVMIRGVESAPNWINIP